MKKAIAQKSNLTKGLIIGLIIGLILGGLAGYLISNNFHKNNFSGRGNFQGNFQIDEQTKNDIVSFFDSTNDTNEINSYCEQNRMYCAYYCRSINPDNGACKNLMNATMGGWSRPPQ